MSFKEITELLDNHYNPKKSAAVQRYKFNTRTRHPGETVSTYIAELKKLAVHCSFERDALNTMLCDRLVCGINDQRIQRRLLAEPELDYDKALTLALAIESADQNASALEKTPPAPETAGSSGGLHRISRYKRYTKPKEQTTDSCYRCGEKHRSSDCRFKSVYCRYCKKQGHIARVCRSRLRAQSSKKASDGKTQDTHQITLEGAPTLPPDEYPLFQVSDLDKDKRTPPLIAIVSVHGKDLPMEVDTGAALSVISKETYLSTWSANTRPPLRPSHVKLRTYSGEQLNVCGIIDVSVIYKQQSKKLSLQVLEYKGSRLAKALST